MRASSLSSPLQSPRRSFPARVRPSKTVGPSPARPRFKVGRMMRGRLQVIFDSALATLATVAALLLATALAPSVNARNARRQTRDGRTHPPSSVTQSARAQDNQTPRAGETNTREGQANTRAEESGVEPDLSITARVTAESLRFEKVPNPKVEFTGRPRRDTVWRSERENIPEQVQPGVTYRDIGITLRITSVFADIDRIVAEALGEVPTSDDARPTPTPSTQPTPAPPSQPGAHGDGQSPATSKLQESRDARTPSPAKVATRTRARGHIERRGRQR